MKILRVIGFTLLGILLLFAVIIAAARAFTPWVTHQKALFEKWSGHYSHTTVHIGKVKAWWGGLHPVLQFNDVTIIPEDTALTPWHLDRLKIRFDLVSSLLHERLQLYSAEIMGASWALHFDKEEHIAIDAVSKVLQTKAMHGEAQAILNWISEQHSFIFRNISVNVYLPDHSLLALIVQRVRLVHSGNKQWITGIIQKNTSEHQATFRIAALIDGDLFDVVDDSIEGYVQVDDVTVTELPLFFRSFKKLELSKGTYSGEVWFSWRNRTIESLQSLFRIDDIEFLQGKQKFVLDQLSGNITWKRMMDGWMLSGNQVEIGIKRDKTWPLTQFVLAVQNTANPALMMFIDYISIADIMPFITANLDDSNPLKEALLSLKPSGELHQFFLEHSGDFFNFSKDNSWRLITKFQNVNWNHWRKLPGVTGLSGLIDAMPTEGKLKLHSAKVTADFGSVFTAPLTADQLFGTIDWNKRADQSWEIQASPFEFLNQVLAVHGDMALLIPSAQKDKNDNGPLLSVLAGFDLNDTSHAKEYLPVGILSEGVAQWLSAAFIAGNGASGHVVIRGHIKEYPFDNNTGTFIVTGRVRNAEFHYAPDWPNLQHINADLTFAGRSMYCQVDAGSFYGSKVQSAQATIPYMGKGEPNMLLVQGAVVSDANDAMAFIQNSPLSKTVGENLAPLQLHGPTHLDLRLTIPLSTPAATKVQGTLQFQKDTLQIPSWNITAKELTGAVLFTENSLKSQELAAILFGKPALLSVDTMHEEDDDDVPYTKVKVNGYVTLHDIMNEFHLPKPIFVSGGFNYLATMDLRTSHRDSHENHIEVLSDMHGVQIDLPEPLHKDATEANPSKLDIWFKAKRPMRIEFSLWKQLSGALLFHSYPGPFVFQSGEVHLGSGSAKQQTVSGLLITGDLPELDWVAWKRVFNQYDLAVSNNGQSKASASTITYFRKILRSVRLTLEFIRLLNQDLHHVVLGLTPHTNGWLLTIDSAAISGGVDIPDKYATYGITGRFKRLFIKKTDTSLPLTDFDPGTIPPLRVSIDEFRYGETNPGNLVLTSTVQNHQLTIQKLSFYSALFNIDALGFWRLVAKNNYSSHLEGQLKSRDLSKLFALMRQKMSVALGSGTIDFSLTWMDAIYHPSIDKINGSISLDCGSGNIVDLGASTNMKLNLGRILTLLDLGRLFELNFSDLTTKGYGFDSVKGQLNLRQGQVDLKQIMFSGSVADLALDGSVNIIKQTVDLYVRVMPHVTSSLPVIAATFVNPLAGVATWAASKVLSKAKVVVYHYRVVGEWNKLNIKKL